MASFGDDAESRDAESSDFVEVPFRPARACTAENSARFYRAQSDYCCPLMIMDAPTARPPLLKDAGASPVYDMGPERGGEVKAYLHVVSAGTGDVDMEVPLRMIPYKTAKDPQKCFDLNVCHDLDAANRTLEEHNRYITSLMSLFIDQNGCGTSAGHVTLPPPPDDMADTRIKRLKEIFKDKFGSTILAVRYLHEHGKVCEKDYPIEKAVAAANDEAFVAYVRKKQERGRFRFRMPGSPPAYWDGNPEHRDSCDRRIKWAQGENHSFISPDVEIVFANDELAAYSTV